MPHLTMLASPVTVRAPEAKHHRDTETQRRKGSKESAKRGSPSCLVPPAFLSSVCLGASVVLSQPCFGGNTPVPHNMVTPLIEGPRRFQRDRYAGSELSAPACGPTYVRMPRAASESDNATGLTPGALKSAQRRFSHAPGVKTPRGLPTSRDCIAPAARVGRAIARGHTGTHEPGACPDLTV